MVFNTALCFIASAAGVFGLVRGGRIVAQVMGLALTFVGTITFLQFPLHRSLGIDQMLISHGLQADQSGPGRMAPNTAIAFALLGAALFFSARRILTRVSMCAASLVLALAAFSICGYLTGLKTAFTWGQFTGMALHTALCFCLLGGSLLILSTRQA